VPIISVNMLAGRSNETKRELIRVLTEGAVSTLGVSPEAVRVLLFEVPPEHWGAGGVPKDPPVPAPGGKSS